MSGPAKWLYLLCILTAARSFGQDPAYWQLGDQEGLPSMTVYDIKKDDRGYLYVGTSKGLARFNGREFHRIANPDLTDQEILNLTMDKFGRIWFHNLSGRLGYISGDRMILPKIPELGDSLLIKTFQILDNFLWGTAFTKEKEYGIVRKRQYLLKLPLKEVSGQFHGELIPANYTSRTTNLQPWDGQITLFSPDDPPCFQFLLGDSFQNGREINNLPSSLARQILSWTPVPGTGDAIFYTLKTIGFIDRKQSSFRVLHTFQDENIKNVSVRDSILWVLTSSGIHTFPVFTKSREKEVFFRGSDPNSFFEDETGTIWIGTNGKGIIVVPSMDILVYNQQNSSLPHDEVYSLSFGQAKEIWIGLGNGQLGNLGPNRELEVLTPEAPAKVRQVFEDADKDLWIIKDLGIEFKKHHTGTAWQQLFPDLSAKVITQTPDGSLWLGTSNFVIELQKDSFTAGKLNPLDLIHRKLGLRTYCLFVDTLRSGVWIGTTNGLFFSAGSNTDLWTRPGFLSGSSRITTLAGSADGSVWIGTYGEGLIRIGNSGVLDAWTSAHGLSSNIITQVAYQQPYVWIGTDAGLNRLDPASGQVRVFADNSGLPYNEIEAILPDDSGIWIGGARGLTYLPYQEMDRPEKPVPVYLSNLQVNGKDRTWSNHPLQLKYFENFLSIGFEGLDFRSQGPEIFQYRLLGLDSTWVNSSDRTARFHSLAPGEYEFQVFFGPASSPPPGRKVATLSIIISPAWWQTWLFRAGLFTAIAALSGGVVYWYQREKLKRERMQSSFREEIQHLQLQALQTQMNPHFIYNALNAIQDFFLTNNTRLALNYLSRFSRMIRLIFQYSQKHRIALQDELEFLTLYLELEKLRFEDKVTISMEVEPSLTEGEQEYFLPPLLIQPIIENAFKHGLLHKLSGGKLDIRFSKTNDGLLKCEIEDNGVGREFADALRVWDQPDHRSSGMEATRKRLDLLHNKRKSERNEFFRVTDLKDKEGKPCGTRIEMWI